MIISEIIQRMIQYSNGNRHDINHFMKVYAYAKTIGELESLDTSTQTILEIAAVIHDIACPLCREKYGNTDWKYQEQEGPALVVEFLKDSGLSQSSVDRIAYLIGHHHTLHDIDGMDYQILVEADYIVNADEHGYPRENIANMLEKVFQTQTGCRILKEIYQV